MAHLLKISVFIVAFYLFVQLSQCQITFTGDVGKDFGNVTYPRNQTLVRVPNYNNITCSKWVQNHNQSSGFDIKGIALQYDWTTDTMYIGWDCWVICGDADGDGDPSKSTDRGNIYNAASNPDPGLLDTHLQIGHEASAQTFWTNTPPNYVPPADGSYIGYTPDVVVGDSNGATFGLPQFDAFQWKLYAGCDEIGYARNSAQCKAQIASEVSGVAANNWGTKWTTLGAVGTYRKVPAAKLAFYPNVTRPDIEFTLGNFSNYGNFSFTPGIQSFFFASSAYFGSDRDSCGEEIVPIFTVAMPCTVRDACGICGGDNSTCWDCKRVPNGNAKYDACGVCGGNNQTCWDCAHVPNGNARYDACGVCDGNNQTCWDCAHIPNGHSVYDVCGVCGGDNTSCWDCAHVPNGPSYYDNCGVCGGDDSTCADCAGNPGGNKKYDACGVCNGNNQTCWDCAHVPNGHAKYDACGVCGGNNQTCWDCAHKPNGPKRYDACGVCGGNNQTCWDCAHIPNGHAKYDACGVCGGNNQTCWDCAHIPNGNAKYDACGVCDGNNQTCWDCAHKPNGNAKYDACGVCGGNNQTCVDCENIPNGGKVYDQCGVCGGDSSTCEDCTGQVPHGKPQVYDECGVCGGDNSTCWDCAHIPNGPWVYDLCGVCGGHNEDCECWIYKNISLIAEDTYVSIEHRNENYDNSMDLVVSSSKERTLLKFDDIRFSILGATEQKPIILSAKIRLYIRGIVKLPQQGWEDNKITLHNLDNNFCAEKATWECRDVDETGCCTEWKMLSLYPKIKADYAWEPTASLEVVNRQQGWVEFDVQDDLEYFLQHSFLNSKSYLIKKECEKDFGWIRFWSSESASHYNAPELFVSIKARCGPEKPLPPPPSPCEDEL